MHKRTILLADDTRFFLDLEKTFFRRDDFDLLTATSGVEALKSVLSAKPDLVFIDLYMPGMNGDEVAGQSRLIRKQSTYP